MHVTMFTRPGDLNLTKPAAAATLAAVWTTVFAIVVAAIGVASVVSANYLGKPPSARALITWRLQKLNGQGLVSA
jgi:hypothetical protein